MEGDSASETDDPEAGGTIEGGEGNDGSDSEPPGESSEDDGEGCPAGMLDCDDEPGCESDAQDPLTCGSCGHSCEFAGSVYSCELGECVGSPVLSGFPDTFTDIKKPNMPRGMDDTLHVRGNSELEHSYISLPPLPAGAQVLDAQLVLHYTGHDLPATFDVYLVESAWGEQGVTWNNPPLVSESSVLSYQAVEGESFIDLTSLGEAWPSPRGISLRDNLGMEHGTCSSKEGENPPRLELELIW